MRLLTILKRTTAATALVALAPLAAQAESAQATGTQPPGVEQQAEPAQPRGQAAANEPDTGGGQTQGASPQGEAPDEADQAQQDAGQGVGPTDTEATQTQGEPAKPGTQGGEAPDEAAQSQAGQDQDALVATVGEREIRRSDVLAVIGMLPPQLKQQPPEVLIPIALDQLVMRELILQEAKGAGLESDPAVTASEGASEQAREDAMVQVWLDRELGKAVTDESVQHTYDQVKQQMGDQAPSMEELRPQIEQELRQQAFLDIGKDLQQGAEITLYGPDGQAITQ
jgi:hypothetical protein